MTPPVPTAPANPGIVHNGGPSLADDMLNGAEQIGLFWFGNDPGATRKIYYLATEIPLDQRPPIFRLGSLLCARKSTLLAWIAEQETRVTSDSAGDLPAQRRRGRR